MVIHDIEYLYWDQVFRSPLIRTGASVTWNVLSWSGGHEFKPRGAWYFCPNISGTSPKMSCSNTRSSPHCLSCAFHSFLIPSIDECLGEMHFLWVAVLHTSVWHEWCILPFCAHGKSNSFLCTVHNKTEVTRMSKWALHVEIERLTWWSIPVHTRENSLCAYISVTIR